MGKWGKEGKVLNLSKEEAMEAVKRSGLSRSDIIKYLWTVRRDLSYLLHQGQKLIRNRIKSSPRQEQVILCSRRWGKSYLAAVLAIESAIGRQYRRILIVCPTLKEAESIFFGHVEDILKDCPSTIAPTYNHSKKKWTFPNGSSIVLGGSDNKNSDRLRGNKADLIIIDEAGMCSDFEYLVESVLRPQTLTTGGKIVMCSTPSTSTAHPFNARYCQLAEEKGELSVYTIYDAPHIDHQKLEEYKEGAGGEKSTAWRREYLCERIVEQSLAIVPEFDALRTAIVLDLPQPTYYKCYTVADFGFNDLTVIGFWEYLFDQGKLYCRDELVFRNCGTSVIAPAIREKELELWGRPADERWGDPNAGASKSHAATGIKSQAVISLTDFNHFHALPFSPVNRQELQQGINRLRETISRLEIAIHPRCTTTISHLRGGIWNSSRTSFERSGEMGHFDGIAMAMYANRHIDRAINPTPLIDPKYIKDGRLIDGIAINPNHPAIKGPQGQVSLEEHFRRLKKR